MRILIIGAVAAGTSAATKARRNNEEAQIVIYEKDYDISYSGCGMPYFIGGDIQDRKTLTPRDPKYFKERYNVDVLIRHEVLSIDPVKKVLQVKNLETNESFNDWYDKLVISTGARAVIPPVKGVEKDHVFTFRTIQDMNKIIIHIHEKKPKNVVVLGSGYVGLEACENFVKIGLNVTLVEKLPQVTSGLDDDMAVHVQKHLEEKNVKVLTGQSVEMIEDEYVLLSKGEKVPADMVLLAVGVKPNTELAKSAGVELGVSGAIQVNGRMETNIKDIYACGDCIELLHLVTQIPVYRPLGSTANKTGRICGDCITGGSLKFRGILGTGIVRVFDLTVAQTGLSEKEAKALGYDTAVIHNIKHDKPEYMGGGEMIIKGVADKKTGRLLGVQIVGPSGVDKRIDVFVTAITYKANVEDLFHFDLAYSPPYSTTKDPVMYTGMILDNAISKGRPVMTAKELDQLTHSGQKHTVIDTRISNHYEKGHVEEAENIPHEKIRETAEKLDKNDVVVTYCNKGTTGNAAQNILLQKGFDKVYNLSGGYKQYSVEHCQKENK